MFSIKFFLLCLKAAITHIPQNLIMTGLVLVICVILGTGIALIRAYRVPVVCYIFDFLMAICKVLPANLVLLIVFVIFNDNFKRVAKALNLSITIRDVNKMYVAVAALVICCISGISELIRSGIKSVPKGQYEAGYSVGMTKSQTFFCIIVPQAVRNIIPPLTSTILSLLKTTALVSVIGIEDIMTAAVGEASITYAFLEAYVAAALVFWVLGLVFEVISGLVERRYKKMA